MMLADGYTETGFKETEIGPIPEDWEVVSLDSLSREHKQSVDPTTLQNEPYVGLEHIAPGVPRLFTWGTSEEVKSSKTHFHKGQILYGKLRPYLDKAVIAPIDGICSTDIIVLSAIDGKTIPDFLVNRLHCQDFVAYATRTTTGVNHPRTHWSSLKRYCIPLPPLPEQRRIAAVLNAIQEEIAAQDDIIAAAREFKRSLLHRLFTYGPGSEPAETKETEIGEIPAHWEVVQFGDVLELLQYGTSKRCDYESKGLPVLRIPNVIGGKIDATDLKFAEFSQGEQLSLTLHDGDMLFVRTNGNREYSGRSAVFHSVPAGALYASYLIRARFRPATLLPDFAQAYTETSMGKSLLSGRASETADGKFNINIGTINTVIAAMPPIWEQEEITEQLKVADSKIAFEEDRRTALKDFFKTMLHQLMTGQIRTTDSQEFK